MVGAIISGIGSVISGTLVGGSTLLNGALDRDFWREQGEVQRAADRAALEQQQHFQRAVLAQEYQQRLKLAAYDRETQMGIEEYRRVLGTLPWRTAPTVVLNKYRELAKMGKRLPLFLVIVPPEIEHDPHAPPAAFPSLEHDLSLQTTTFLDHLEEHHRRIEYWPGLWDTKRYKGEAAAENLYALFREIPVLLLESHVSFDSLSLRASTWGLGGHETGPSHSYIVRLPYRSILSDFAKQDALAWKDEREKLFAAGRDAQYLSQVGGAHEVNLTLFEQELEDRKIGVLRPRAYSITNYDWQKLSRLVSYCQNLTIGLVSDLYDLLSFQNQPILPKLLSTLNGSLSLTLPTDTVQPMLESYDRIYDSVGPRLRVWLPDLYLGLAILAANADLRSRSSEYFQKALAAWRMATGNSTLLQPSDIAIEAIRQLDYPFVKKMVDACRAMEENSLVDTLRTMLNSEEPKLDVFG